MSKRSQRDAWYASLVSLGMPGGQAGQIANNPNFDAARNAYNQAYGVYYTQRQRDIQNQQREALLRQQQALLKAAKNTPKTSKALRGREYTPKFRASVSEAETKRAVSKGTYQFANPLSMGLGGSGFGGGTGPNLGG